MSFDQNLDDSFSVCDTDMAMPNESNVLNMLIAIDQRLSNIECYNRDLNDRITKIERVLSLGPSTSTYVTERYPSEWSLRSEQDYNNYAKQKFAELRNNFEWRKCFNSMKFAGLSLQQRSNIDKILNKGQIKVSRIINGITIELLGKENIKNFIVGTHGMVTLRGSAQAQDKRPTLPLDQENKLRTFFSFIDKVFISTEGWEILIRKPINQMGREFVCGKRKIDHGTASSMLLSSQDTLQLSQSSLNIDNQKSQFTEDDRDNDSEAGTQNVNQFQGSSNQLSQASSVVSQTYRKFYG